MKRELIYLSLAAADSVYRHPKRVGAVVASLLLLTAGASFAVSKLPQQASNDSVRLVSETLDLPGLTRVQAELLGDFSFTLYRNAEVRSHDTPESLLKRLGIADPQASQFLRQNATAHEALFASGAAGRNVMVEASERQELEQLKVSWKPREASDSYKQLVLSKSDGDFHVELQEHPLQMSTGLGSGTIDSSFYAAAKRSGLPSAVTEQITRIFSNTIKFRSGLKQGDHFSVVYEVFQADDEVLGTGKVLSAEFVNGGKTHQFFWFDNPETGKGSYHAFSEDAPQAEKSETMAWEQPLPDLRVTSTFGYRKHPITGVHRGHLGTDFGAPTGTAVKVASSGRVKFAGWQKGYGKVIFVEHNARETTVYAHLSQMQVEAGQSVKQGQVIGNVGQTGYATGPHLHFEYRLDGQPQDPVPVLAQRQTTTKTASTRTRRYFEQLKEQRGEQLAQANAMLSAQPAR